MIIKAIEIRDWSTFIPAIAIKMIAENEKQRYLMAHVGFHQDNPGIILMCMNDQKATSDPHEWPMLGKGVRTLPHAHMWLIKHFDKIQDGWVVDVRLILRETDAPARPEREENTPESKS